MRLPCFLLVQLLATTMAFRTMHAVRRIRPELLSMASEGFFDVNILQNKPAAEGVRFIEVAVPSAVKEGFKNPGQYVQMKRDGGKPGYVEIPMVLSIIMAAV